VKYKVLCLFLILSSLLGYLEWGGNNHTFLFKAEAEIIFRLFSNPASVIHPFVILPLLGQMFLLITLFQRKPNKALVYIGIGGIGLLFVLMFFIGLISLNFKIVLSTIPFILFSVLTIVYFRKVY